jgi:predicted regulator of Ras-like GTPase activity (Roadblock/LC7/MglB family)
VQELWEPVAKRLLDDTVSSVLLCTSAGKPLAAHGIPVGETSRVCGLTGALFGAGEALTTATHAGDDSPIETVSITAGRSHTVVAALPAAVGGHLVSVTAQGVSLGVLLVRTRQAADELRVALSGTVD